MAKGWIKVDRAIFDNWLWQDKPFSKGQAWIDLLLLANYEDKKTLYKGEVITCERGVVNLSITYLAERWGWSRKYVRSYLKALENDKMVTTKVSTHRTTIKLVNYSVFQDFESEKNAEGINQGINQGISKGINKGNTTKNIKNKRNKEYIGAPAKADKWEQKNKRQYDFKELERMALERSGKDG